MKTYQRKWIKIIDSEGGDLRGIKLLSKLEKEKLLNENIKNETIKSVHYITSWTALEI